MKLWGSFSRVRLAVAMVCIAASSVFGLATAPARATPPTIKHVWIITLENESANATFGPASPAHYLNDTLKPQGVFVPNYYGIGHASLDNYIAMISGQGPNMLTQADCIFYMDVVPGVIGPLGQAAGEGCVYPKTVRTFANQLYTHGQSWKGYMQDMGNTPSRESTTCAHPPLNSVDGTQQATAVDNYATRHNPFMYFHSIIDNKAFCKTHVVRLEALTTDLATASTTPSFSFITPSLCDDGHDAPCADGRPGGLVSADAFLATWAPAILASPAYAEGGMLIINVDESTSSDAEACCNELPNPGGSPLPGISGLGGGRTGAVIVSSRTTPGTTTTVAYNHYSLLRSLENLFGYEHLGFAKQKGLKPFGADIYSAT